MNGRMRSWRAGTGVLGLLTSGLIVVGGAVSASATPMADPPGNNGVVKIQETDADTLPPDNNPHVGCSFDVEFYNYDQGEYYADVMFETQSPTTGGVTVTGDTHPFIGGDPASGGNDLDARETYTLSFTGEPHDQQGFHVKVTVTAPFSKGDDTKSKVFWVSGCSTPTSTTSTTTTTTTTGTTTSTTSTTTTGTTTTGTMTTGTTTTTTGSMTTGTSTTGTGGQTPSSDTGTVPGLVQTDGPGGGDGSGALFAALAGAFLVLGSVAWMLLGRRFGVTRGH